MKRKNIIILAICIIIILSIIGFTYGRFTYESETIGSVTTTSRNPFEIGTLAYNIVNNAMHTKDKESTIYSEEPLTTPAKEINGENERTLSVTEDDYGISYYYRGNVKDNYIDFNGMCWRIVRIEGDGSIKLILEDKTSTCKNATGGDNAFIGKGSWGYKGGWTIDNPLDFDYENNELGVKEGRTGAKQLIDEWLNNFNKNLLKEDTWCMGNATTWYKFGDWNTAINNNEVKESVWSESYKRTFILKNTTLKCSENEKSVKDYGSLLTIDELLNSGFNTALNESHDNVYLQLKNNTTEWWLLNIGYRNEFKGNGSFCVLYKNTMDGINALHMIRPSIVLNSGIKITSGDGTKDNAYKIDENPFESGTLAYSIVNNAINPKEDTSTIYSPVPKTIPAQEVSGENERTLSVTEDTLGRSYYFRGNVNDNYLNFNNMCWRIVRIEGDGSIKLILEDKTKICESAEGGENAFIGQGSYGYKYVNSSIAPDYENCTADTETCMRTILQKWFNEKFTDSIETIYPSNNKPTLKSEFQNIIKYEKWRLEDTTTTVKVFGSDGYPIRERLWDNSNPYATLLYLENDTSFNDYVSSLSADEVVFAGLVAKTPTNKNSYIFKLQNHFNQNTNYIRLISHYSTTTSAGLCDNGTLSCGISGGSGVKSTTGYIWPSIILNKGIKITSGDGTKGNPYTIENTN